MPPEKSATFRYVEIAEDLRERIAEGDFAASGKLPSEQDLAGRFGVNRLTLRKAIGILEDEGLVVRHRGRGTFVGRAPVTEARQETCVFVGDPSLHFWSDVYAGLGKRLQDAGHRLMSYRPPVAPGELDNAFGAWISALDPGAKVVCQFDLWQAVAPALSGGDYSSVVISLSPNHEDLGVSQVMPDNVRAGYLATRHLVELGLERIAFVGFGSEPSGHDGFFRPFPGNQAYAGYLDAMRVAELPTDGLALGYYSGGDQKATTQIAAFMASLGEWPTGIVCQQDYKARDILAVAAQQGIRLPDQTQLVSIGNTPWAEAMLPALTSVDLQPERMADLALHLLEQSGEHAPCLLRVEPRLVPRESTHPFKIVK